VKRALAYCAFHHRAEITLPQSGVSSGPVHVLEQGELRLLWSDVDWPPPPERMQKSAVEFHDVVNHVFKQAAVIPFRLLSVFDDEASLAAFASEHEPAFIEDLERLKDCVQMECVIYPAPARPQVSAGSGTEYLRGKMELAQGMQASAAGIKDAVAHVARDVKISENKNGTRIFVLVERGREPDFRRAVKPVSLAENLARRFSGPWPAAEFLSDRVRTPQIADAK